MSIRICRLWALLAAVGLSAVDAVAESAKIQIVREVWVPESWTKPEVTGAVSSSVGVGPRTIIGSSYKPSVPELRKRELGVSGGVVSATVHPKTNGSVNLQRELVFADGRRVEVKGKYLRIDDIRYEVVGQIGDYFYLKDDRSNKYWRFSRKEEAPAPEGPAKDAAAGRK